MEQAYAEIETIEDENQELSDIMSEDRCSKDDELPEDEYESYGEEDEMEEEEPGSY